MATAIAELYTEERETKITTSMSESAEAEKNGVLLYYKYTSSPIEDLNQLFTFYESNCSSLGLLGRVRLAPQGVNVTIGGKVSLLHNHITSLLDDYGGFFEGTDFKLASCDEPLSMEVAKECGFTSLSIRIVKELVTLSSNPMVKTPSISNAGRHLSALEFHSVLQNSGELLKEESPIDFKRLVLLDARNLYETRIGKFESPEVETLDPATRQYSDLPAWIDSNAEKLRGKCVLMKLGQHPMMKVAEVAASGVMQPTCRIMTFIFISNNEGHLKRFEVEPLKVDPSSYCMRKPLQIHASAFSLGLNFIKDLSAVKLLKNRKFYIDTVMVLRFLELLAYATGFLEDRMLHVRYCTGGIRCEMASAYIRSKGAGFENVFQLYGGIQRYLEQFPDGGFFKGKNFVYDHRISVGSSNTHIMGKCLLCGTTFDDYSSRCRCAFCRMLVLVCNDCQNESGQYVCELCENHGKAAQTAQSVDNDNSEMILECNAGITPTESPSHHSTSHFHFPRSPGPLRKLRILCLHGFRQNASSFKGRTAALTKKLKSLAELVFVNAPHELPFIYQPRTLEKECISSPPHHNPPPTNCSKKYAWLVAPHFYKKEATDWEKSDMPFSPLQYQQQTEGFAESLSYMKSVVSKEGPFDGILGFSQGAAMAALLCAERGRLNLESGFRFVILCSGFAVNLAGHEKGSITCPSLHVFGNEGGGDRQISSGFSRDLASYFEDGCRTIIEHDSGHIIPTRPPYIDEVREFLRQFI